MTYPLPKRLVPVRAEKHRTQGAVVLAIVAAICFVLAFFNVSVFDGHSLIALGLFFLALHLIVPVAIPGRRV